jgi:peptidoglycan/xylan/chitin deacetylase (PgdA/CDA1 family)
MGGRTTTASVRGRRALVRIGRSGGQTVALIRIAALRLTDRRVGAALLYHTVAERPGDPNRELVPAVSRALFRRQVQHLRRSYRLVPAADFPDAVSKRRRFERIPVCVTFDDDDVEHVNSAVPILVQQGVPATFFLSGVGLEGQTATWWQRLQTAADRGVALERIAEELGRENSQTVGGSPTIHRIADAIEAMGAKERQGVSDRLVALAGPDPPHPNLDSADIAHLIERGFEIGFHTRGHDRLTDLDDAGLARAMRVGRDQLERAARARIETIAYPHGRSDSRVTHAARAAGYRVGFGNERRVATPKSDPLSLGRFEPGSMSPVRFAMALSSLLRGQEDNG